MENKCGVRSYFVCTAKTTKEREGCKFFESFQWRDCIHWFQDGACTSVKARDAAKKEASDE
jgi:hypothetical protein